MNHYYQTIGEDWFSYKDYYKNIVDGIDEGFIAEIGCWKGRSVAFLGVEIMNQKKDIEVWCIDSWKYHENTEQPCKSQDEFDRVHEEFLKNIKPIKSVIKVYNEDSVKASERFGGSYFEHVFLDASHHYKDVLADLEAWFPKCRNMAGHDYFTRVHPGVKQAVDEFFNYDVWCNPRQNIWVK